MTSELKFDVFLSHSSHDKTIVRALAERLRHDGVRVWFDEWEIQVGDSIPSRIEEGLAQSRLLVLCMSAHAFGSDWATLENQGFRFRDPLNKDRRFIPLRLDHTEPKGTLAQFLYIDWRGQTDAAYQKLLRTCIGPEATSAHPAVPTEFAAYASAWPHQRDGLHLAFMNEARQIISAAHSSTKLEQCDDFMLHIDSSKTGQLALFLYSTDQSWHQLYPHTLSRPQTLAAGEYDFPGNLLDISAPAAQPERRRLCFQAPGIEQILCFLTTTLPPCITPRAPLAQLDDTTMQTILTAFFDDNNAALAVASVAVTQR